MKFNKVFLSTLGLTVLIAIFASSSSRAATQTDVDIPIVDKMPDMPAYLSDHPLPDWHARATAFTALMFDPTSGIEYTDPSGYFALPPYWGSLMVGPTNDPYGHDGVSTLGSIYDRCLLGESNGKYLPMITEFYQQPAPVGNNARVYAPNVNTEKGGAYSSGGSNVGTFWYALLTTYYAFGLTMHYGDSLGGGLVEKMHMTASQWHDAGVTLNYDYVPYNGYDFINGKGTTGVWREPDAPAGAAWVEYMAYQKFPSEKKFLTGSEANMAALEAYNWNPNYEGPILCMGALTAARLNAEQNQTYDVGKIVNWIFDNTYDNISPVVISPGAYWNNIGVRTGSYGPFEVNGLTGGPWALKVGLTRTFSLESMTPPIGLLPLVRYDPRFATPLGKYLLNLATNARLFYTDFLPAGNQDQSGLTIGQLPQIPFESFDEFYTINGATVDGVGRGDPTANTPPWATSDRSIYGGQAVGILGSTVQPTNNPRIPRWDCLKLDIAGSCPYPTYLYYNPYAQTKKLSIDCGQTTSDIYELTTHSYLSRNIRGTTSFSLPAKKSYVICIVPHSGIVQTIGHQLLVNGHVIDYWTNGM